MKREVYIPLISLLCCMALLISCSSEEEIPLPKPSKEDIWYWGYFKGEVNGNKISLENENNEGPVHSGRAGVYFGDEKVPDSINIMGTGILYNNHSNLYVHLYNLTPGKRYLNSFFNNNWDESYIKATVYKDASLKEIKAQYIPSKENPFRVEITDVIWASRREPIIEVELDGVLYNRENPKDTMVIKGIYGSR